MGRKRPPRGLRVPGLVLLVSLSAGLASSCLMHDTACYDRCLTQHRQCITLSRDSAALEQCDARLATCRGGCSW